MKYIRKNNLAHYLARYKLQRINKFLFCGKFFAIFLSFILYNLFFITPASAHLVGQPPFFRINGTYSNLYPIISTSLSDFELPQDLATENYLVNKPINFDMELNILPIPKEVIDRSKFYWDFGDGTKGEGTKNTHTYTKPGSYILVIRVTADNQEPQILQSVLLNILPSSGYVLPKSQFSVNGWTSSDPATDVLQTKFDSPFKFDASKSQTTSSPVKEYIWDFGDQTSGSGITPIHKYTTQPYAVMVVLRIKTEDGFITDSYAQIKEGDGVAGFIKSQSSDNTETKLSTSEKIFAGVIILVGLYGGYFILVKIFKRRRK